MTTDTIKSRSEQAPLAVVCADCGARKELDDANEAVVFYRRHHSVTGHDIRWECSEIGVLETVPKEGLKIVVHALEKHFTAGVPIGTITAVMDQQDSTIGETLDTIYELRMDGALYEPQRDHIKAT